MIILTLGCSNKTAEKEMKMPMLFDTRDQAEKKHINLVEKELIKWGINGCHVACTKITINNECLISPIFINLELFFCRDLLQLLLKKFLREFILFSRILIKQVTTGVLAMTTRE